MEEGEKIADTLYEEYKKALVCNDGSDDYIALEYAIKTCEKIIGELQHHSDLSGFFQDNNGRQSVIGRISVYTEAIKELKKIQEDEK